MKSKWSEESLVVIYVTMNKLENTMNLMEMMEEIGFEEIRVLLGSDFD